MGGGIISMEGYPDQRQLITVRSTNITAVGHAVTREARSGRNGHKGAVLWFTGLSGAGKSTLALALERELFAKGYQVYVLDGDNIRAGLNANLGFSPEDRAENIRRVGEVASLFADAGFIVISSFISPYRSDRERARAAAKDAFHEVYVKASLEACEGRDPKGLYKRAPQGRDPRVHRHQQPLRGAGPPRPGGADRRAAGRRVPGAADPLRRGPLPGLSALRPRRLPPPRSGSPRIHRNQASAAVRRRSISQWFSQRPALHIVRCRPAHPC